MQRIEERGRPMEQQTPITYWEEMHERYERWINSFDACPVLKININDYDLMKNPEEIEQVIERIGNTIEISISLKQPFSPGCFFVWCIFHEWAFEEYTKKILFSKGEKMQCIFIRKMYLFIFNELLESRYRIYSTGQVYFEYAGFIR